MILFYSTIKHHPIPKYTLPTVHFYQLVLLGARPTTTTTITTVSALKPILMVYTYDLITVLSQGSYTRDTMNIIYYMFIGFTLPPLIYKTVSSNFSYFKLYQIPNIMIVISLVFPQRHLICWWFIKINQSRKHTYNILSSFLSDPP